MSWKTSYRSIYYAGAPEPDDLVLPVKETALLVIDVQNTYLERPDRGQAFQSRAGATLTPGLPFTSACAARSFPARPSC